MGKGRAFMLGTLSGAVEPLAAILTVLLSGLVVPVLPYLLSFAAGAMVYEYAIEANKNLRLQECYFSL